MDMNTYIQDALRTESTIFKPDHPRLLHAVVGLQTEATEALVAGYNDDRDNLAEELGDLLWYAAIAADEFEATFSELMMLADPPSSNMALDLAMAASAALDHLKKVTFYGREIDRLFLARKVGTILSIVHATAQQDLGYGLDVLQEANIAKLRVRYPEKFTPEAAEARRDHQVSGSQG